MGGRRAAPPVEVAQCQGHAHALRYLPRAWETEIRENLANLKTVAVINVNSVTLASRGLVKYI